MNSFQSSEIPPGVQTVDEENLVLERKLLQAEISGQLSNSVGYLRVVGKYGYDIGVFVHENVIGLVVTHFLQESNLLHYLVC